MKEMHRQFLKAKSDCDANRRAVEKAKQAWQGAAQVFNDSIVVLRNLQVSLEMELGFVDRDDD